jgi:hypothetical protein
MQEQQRIAAGLAGTRIHLGCWPREVTMTRRHGRCELHGVVCAAAVDHDALRAALGQGRQRSVATMPDSFSAG